jgi:small GTP-binding protein
MDLREYEQYKFSIAEILRSAALLVPEEERVWHDRCRELFVRLAEDRFNLVVVGRFSRGKTSLMNAIMGSDRLPTGITPLTSVITAVTYGSQEQVVLKFQGRSLDRDVPVEDLPKYITQEQNPGNVQRIRIAEVHLSAEILRRGFYFIDTPGLGSVFEENTITTESFLPEADAFLLVTSYESPLTEEEMRFFRAAADFPRRIFVVVNKQDAVSIQERNAVLEFVRDQLRAMFGDTQPKIFSVSAREGLDLKKSGDFERLEETGIPGLEKELTHFLIAEKSMEFLYGMSTRAKALIQEISKARAIGTFIKQLDEMIAELRGEKSLQRYLGPGYESALSRAHQLDSCEICTQVTKKLWEFFSRYQYELSVDRNTQEHFAVRAGFCPFHTWEYESIASPYGTSKGYPVLFDRLANVLHTKAEGDNPAAAIWNLFPGEEHCLACQIRAEAETVAVKMLAARLEKNPAVIASLSAICFPHFAMIMQSLQDESVVRRLLERQSTIFRRMSEDMKRYALKYDAVRRYLQTEEERTASHRALLFIAGRRSVNFRFKPNCLKRSN